MTEVAVLVLSGVWLTIEVVLLVLSAAWITFRIASGTFLSGLRRDRRRPSEPEWVEINGRWYRRSP